MTSSETRSTDNYLVHWLLVFALLGTGGSYLWKKHHTFQPAPAVTSPAVPGSQSYLILRFPEIPMQEMRSEYMRGIISNWLQALLKGGFQPMLLSQVATLIRRGEGLPARTIVIVFDPAYRHTYDVVGPIFQKLRVPAVWLTHANAAGIVDRRYLNTHILNQMKRSGTWDVGLYDKSGHLTLEGPERTQIVFPQGQSVWLPNTGRRALNWGLPQHPLHRLNINARWSDRELIDRLLVETPLQQTSYLTTRQIGNRTWGVLMETSQPSLARFSLRTRPDRRSAIIGWTGTRGVMNAEMRLEAASIRGELWLSFRTDDESGQGVHVGFSREGVFIDQEMGRVRNRLLTAPPVSMNSLSAVVLLSGAKIAVHVDGEDPIVLNTLMWPVPSTDGDIHLSVYDQINGAARVDWVTLRATPLPNPQNESSL